MINPHTKTGEDLAHVAEHLATWPMNTDFVHVQSGVIHMIEGGSSLAVSYISREQWAAAKSLHQYWFPEKQPKPEGFCDVCGDTHCIYELYPGICEEYDGGMVSLDLAKAIYNGDFRPENAEEGGMKNSDQVKQWGAAEDDFLAPEIGVVESFLGSPFSTPEEDEEWEKIERRMLNIMQNGNDGSHYPEKSIAERYPHYYKSVRHLEYVDVYQVHHLFAVEDWSGCVQHASKKLLLSGARTGGKPKRKDIEEARDTLTRWLEIQDEKETGLEVELGR